MVSVEDAVFLHTVAIHEFGGAPGVREVGRLEATLARPGAGMGSQRVFDPSFARAAAVWEAISLNHPFVDGNKRVSVMVAAYWLELEGVRLEAAPDDLVLVAVAVAAGKLRQPELARWLESNSAALEPG